MMTLEETRDFVRIVDGLARLYPRLPHIAATYAVNFFKQSFIRQAWLGQRTEPWAKRKKEGRRKGRAIGIDRGVLKRDIHKIRVTSTTALIGTSRITQAYAKAFNEGFKGTVNVKEHTRARFKKVKEQYTTRAGNVRNRTSKQVDEAAGSITVGTHRRKMNQPARPYMKPSPVLDKGIERTIGAAMLKVIKQNSSK